MHRVYPKAGLEFLCGLFGYTRQAYYKRRQGQQKQLLQTAIIVDLVNQKRHCIPRIGGRKLFHMLDKDFKAHHIYIGRDRFFAILRENDLLIKVRKKRAVTTMSRHRLKKYPNLIEGLVVEAPNCLWVSDITYIRVQDSWCYVIFITDAYSRKVVGYQVSDRATAAFCEEALQQALNQWKDRTYPLIHHSDRGVQYCSALYTETLKQNDIAISMTQNGDPLENPIAERVNGIFKSDFLMDQTFDSLHQAVQQIQQMVYHYNHTRPHASCDYLTPYSAHQMQGTLRKRW